MNIYFINLFVCFCLNSVFAGDFIRPPNGKEYPITMIDPVVHSPSDPLAIHQFFIENGYVIIEGVSTPEHRNNLVQVIDSIIEKEPSLSRRIGFLDLYHDDTLAQLRQDPRIYEIFANLLGTKKLWVVFDRIIYQKKTEYEDPLPPHVDQNPITHPDFFNVQAMLALRDMNESTGTLAVLPRSHLSFQDYAAWAKPTDGYIEHQGDLSFSFAGLRLKEGQLVIWDSRTTHSRFRGISKADRYAALITFTPAQEDHKLFDLRLKYFAEGIGWNCHEAGLRATARPRYEKSLRQQAEGLSSLGRKLYGIDKWED